MKKVILFGATGFIGSHVAEQLVAAGELVTAVVREGSNTAFLESQNVEIIRINFHSAQSIIDAIRGHEVVFNCLANPQIHQSEANYRLVEVELTNQVFGAAVAAGANRFVQLSTVMVYGFDRPATAIDENFPCAPGYPFSQVALEREETLQAAAADKDIELVILRPANCIGERDTSFLPPYLALHRLGLFPVFGDGSAHFSCIDARDVGRAMAWLGRLESANGETYLAKGFDTSWLELKTALDDELKRQSRLLKTSTSVARFFARLMEAIIPYGRDPQLTSFAVDALTTDTLFSDDKIRQTGFNSQYSLTDALAAAIPRA